MGKKLELVFYGEVSDNGEPMMYAKSTFAKKVGKAFKGKEIEYVIREKVALKSNRQLRYYYGAVLPIFQQFKRDCGDMLSIDDARYELEKQSPVLQYLVEKQMNHKKVMGVLFALKAEREVVEDVVLGIGKLKPKIVDGSLVYETDEEREMIALVKAGGAYDDGLVYFHPKTEKRIKGLSTLPKADMSEHIDWACRMINIWSDGLYEVLTPEEYYDSLGG